MGVSAWHVNRDRACSDCGDCTETIETPGGCAVSAPTVRSDRASPLSAVAALALIIVLAVWFGSLGLRELMPSDEGRYAQIAREMAQTGDWVTIRYNGLKYFYKPPFHLWMSALAFDMFGVGVWQARVWAAVSGLLAVAMMMIAAARWWGRTAAAFTGWVLLAMPLWNMGAHFNSLDMAVSAALAGALSCFLIAQHPQASRASRQRWMLGVWAAMGVAVLSKGLIGLVLPGLVLVVYTLWSRDWALWRRMHFGSGLLVFSVVTVPWFYLVIARNPEFAHFFFIHEHFERYTSTVHRRHEPWWFFLPLVVAGFLPWSGLWAGLVRRVRETPRQASVFQPERLLATWVLSILVFFSASGSKLPGYILPIMPALALLGALALTRVRERGLVRQLWVMLGVAVVFAAATPLVGRLGSAITPQPLFERYALWLAVAAAIAVAGTAAALVFERRARRVTAVSTYALAWLVASTVGIAGHGSISRSASGVDLVPAVSAVLEPQMPLYGVHRLDHTLPFYLGHRLTMVEYADELAFGARQQPDAWLPTLAQFVDRWQHGPRALAVMAPASFDALRAQGVPMSEVARDTRRVVVANFTVRVSP